MPELRSFLDQTSETPYQRHLRLLITIGFSVAGIIVVFMFYSLALSLGSAGAMAVPLLRKPEEEKDGTDNASDGLTRTGENHFRQSVNNKISEGFLLSASLRRQAIDKNNHLLSEDNQRIRSENYKLEYTVDVPMFNSQAAKNLAAAMKIARKYPKEDVFFFENLHLFKSLEEIFEASEDAKKFNLVKRFIVDWDALLISFIEYDLIKPPYAKHMYPVILEMTEIVYHYAIDIKQTDGNEDFTNIINSFVSVFYNMKDKNALSDIPEDQFAKAAIIACWSGNFEVLFDINKLFKKGSNVMLGKMGESLFIKEGSNTKVNMKNIPVGIIVSVLRDHGKENYINDLEEIFSKSRLLANQKTYEIDDYLSNDLSLDTIKSINSLHSQLLNNVLNSIKNLILVEKDVNLYIKLTSELLRKIKLLEENAKNFDKLAECSLKRILKKDMELLKEEIFGKFDVSLFSSSDKSPLRNGNYKKNSKIENQVTEPQKDIIEEIMRYTKVHLIPWFWNIERAVLAIFSLLMGSFGFYIKRVMEEGSTLLAIQKKIESYFLSSFQKKIKNIFKKGRIAHVLYTKNEKGEEEIKSKVSGKDIQVEIQLILNEEYEFLSCLDKEKKQDLLFNLFFDIFDIKKHNHLISVELESNIIMLNISGHMAFWKSFIKNEIQLSDRIIQKLNEIHFAKLIKFTLFPQIESSFENDVYCKIDENGCILSWEAGHEKTNRFDLDTISFSHVIEYMLFVIFDGHYIKLDSRKNGAFWEISVTRKKEYDYISIDKREKQKIKVEEIIETFFQMRAIYLNIAEISFHFISSSSSIEFHISPIDPQDIHCIEGYLREKYQIIPRKKKGKLIVEKSISKKILCTFNEYKEEQQKMQIAKEQKDSEEGKLIYLNMIIPMEEEGRGWSWKDMGEFYELNIPAEHENVITMVRFNLVKQGIVTRQNVKFTKGVESSKISVWKFNILNEKSSSLSSDSDNLWHIFSDLKKRYDFSELELVLSEENQLLVNFKVPNEVTIRGRQFDAKLCLDIISTELNISTTEYYLNNMISVDLENVRSISKGDLSIKLRKFFPENEIQSQKENKEIKKSKDNSEALKYLQRKKESIENEKRNQSKNKPRGDKEAEKEQEDMEETKLSSSSLSKSGLFCSKRASRPAVSFREKFQQHTKKLKQIINELNRLEFLAGESESFAAEELRCIYRYSWLLRMLTELNECYKTKSKELYSSEYEWMKNISDPQNIMSLRLSISRSILSPNFAEIINGVFNFFRNRKEFIEKKFIFQIQINQHIQQAAQAAEEENLTSLLLNKIKQCLDQLVEVKRSWEKEIARCPNLEIYLQLYHGSWISGIILKLRELFKLGQETRVDRSLSQELGSDLYNLLKDMCEIRNKIVHQSIFEWNKIAVFITQVETELSRSDPIKKTYGSKIFEHITMA